MLPNSCTVHDQCPGTTLGKLLLGKQVPDVGVCYLCIVAHVRFAGLELQRHHCGASSMCLLLWLVRVLHPALVLRDLTLSHKAVHL